MRSRSSSISLAQATGLLTIANALGLGLNFFLGILVAQAFGTSAEMDAYTIAISVPESLQYLLMIGTLSLVFTPMFIHLRTTEGDAVAWRVANTLLTLTALSLLLVVGVLIPVTPLLVRLLAPGFTPQTQQLALSLTRLLLPSVLFYAGAAVLLGISYAYRDFKTPALNTVLVSALGIAGFFVFVVWLDLGILGLVISRLVTLSLVTILLLWFVKRLDPRFGPRLALDRRATQVLSYMPFYVVGAVSGQLSLIVNRRFASELGIGSVAAFSYGQRITDIPLALVGVAFGTALLPSLAAYIAEGRYETARKSFFRGVIVLSFLMTPMMIALVVLRTPVIRLFLARGAFDAASTHLTGLAVAGLGCGLLARAVGSMVVRGLPAFRTRRAPAVLSIASSATDIGLTIILVRWLGLLGIALAVSAGELVFVVLGMLFYQRRLGNGPLHWLIRHLGQIAVCGLLMIIVMQAVVYWFPVPASRDSFLLNVLHLVGIGSAGLVTFGLSAMLLNPDVVRTALRWLRQLEQSLVT